MTFLCRALPLFTILNFLQFYPIILSWSKSTGILLSYYHTLYSFHICLFMHLMLISPLDYEPNEDKTLRLFPSLSGEEAMCKCGPRILLAKSRRSKDKESEVRVFLKVWRRVRKPVWLCKVSIGETTGNEGREVTEIGECRRWSQGHIGDGFYSRWDEKFLKALS